MGISDKLVRATVKARAAMANTNARKATDLLRAQHRLVDGLFAKIEEASSIDRRRKLTNELAQNLVAHMIIEQEIFYPACRADAKLKSIVTESFEEHEVAQHELERALGAVGNAKTFKAHVKVLKELIHHHVKEEEGMLFPRAERSLGSDRLMALATEMKPRFERTMKNGGAAARTRAGASAGAERADRSSGQARRAAAKSPRRSASRRSPRR